MPQSFLEGMRLNSIYPSTPAPGPSMQDILGAYQTQILPMIHGEQDRQFGMNQRMMAQIRAQKQMDEMPFNNPQPNVQLGAIPGAISPLDNAKLGLEKEKIKNTKTAKASELEFKQSKEATDADIKQQRLNLNSSIHDMSDSDKLSLINRAKSGDIEARGKIQRELLGIKGTQATALEDQKQTGRTDLETQKGETRGWKIGNIPDPTDPTKQVGVRYNEITGVVEPVKFGGQDIPAPAPAKAGSDNPLTTSTKTMMEGAQMLRPHVQELRDMVTDLDKRGLFGPIMSRVRDLAAKVGTVGDPGEVQKQFGQFADALANDPKLNASGDAAVGRFITSLGLMASGAGRVHGGARGGGSIQMVNYMKSLLSSSSTPAMFNGRLDSLDSYLKGYAAGPPKPKEKTPLDSTIDDILSGKSKTSSDKTKTEEAPKTKPSAFKSKSNDATPSAKSSFSLDDVLKNITVGGANAR